MMIDLAAPRRGVFEVPLRFGFFKGEQRIERAEATGPRTSERVDSD
jgi:hypothetical protein